MKDVTQTPKHRESKDNSVIGSGNSRRRKDRADTNEEKKRSREEDMEISKWWPSLAIFFKPMLTIQVHKLTQTMDEWEIGLAVIAKP